MSGLGEPIPRRHPAVADVELDGEVVLYDQRSGRVHVLNRTAATLWACLGTGGTVDDLVDDLVEVYEVPAESLLDDVTTTLARFASEGLVDDDAPWTPLVPEQLPAGPRYLDEPPSV